MQTAATVALVLQVSAGLVGPAEPTRPSDASSQVSPAQGAGAAAHTTDPKPKETSGPDARFEPYLIGWSSEPAMEYGGLIVASVQRLSSRLLGSTDAARARPGLAAAWEFPFAELLSIFTHEVNGHGGRAREFDLDPYYGFELFGLAAWTGTKRVPDTVEEMTLVSAAGTEADSVLAHRLLVDLVRPDGAEGSTLPLALLAKIDLTLYVATMVRPSAGRAADFQGQYQDGHDIANYLVSRQGQRLGFDVDDLWNQVAVVDFADPLLEKNSDAARVAAVWNVLDPVLIGATVEYFREHLFGGAVRIRPPMLELGGGVGVSAGTRAFLAPSYVTRYLDVFVRLPFGVASIYGRDLDSSIDRSYGWGAAFTAAPLGTRFSANVTGEWWTEPVSAEYGSGRPGWNVSGEVRVPAGHHVGVAVNVGHKTDGFVPGRPARAGTYAGLGVLVSPW